MYSTKRLAAPVCAPGGISHHASSPQRGGGGRPSPLPSGPTRPLLRARNAGSLRHCGQVGRASARRPAIASSRNGDQKIIAARPAKYVLRVVSTSWTSFGDERRASST